MRAIYIILISLIIGILLGLTISNFTISNNDPTITGQVIEESQYTYTTAICNGNNECIDVLVECESSSVASLTPVSDLIEFGPDWEDFREKKKFCE